MPIIKTDKIEVTIDDATLDVAVRDLRTGKLWRMAEEGPGDIGVKGHCGPYQSFLFRDAAKREWTSLSPVSVQAQVSGWNYSANVWSPLSFGLVATYTVRENDLTIHLAPLRQDSHEASIIDSYYPRGFRFPEKSAGDLVLPVGQGCLFDKDSTAVFDMVLPGYVGVGFVMPWWGQRCRDGAALIACTTTPDDLGFRVCSDGGRRGATVHPYWQASLGGFKYARSMTYSFFDNASVMDLAKAYRRHAELQGLALTLREKAAERPAVESLVGGPHLHIWFMSTFSRFGSAARVNYMRFAEGLRRYRKLCDLAGIGPRALAHIDGWCRDGYDFNHPEPLPPDVRLGGWEGLRRLRDGIQELGHRVVLHDNYVDYYKHTAAFACDEGVMNLDGIKHESIEWLGGPQQWLCSTRAQKYLERTCDEMAAHRCAFNGFYLDCWSIGHLRECYDPNHPATRGVTRQAWSEALAVCHNLGQVVGSESGNDWAVPVMDYCHTVQPDIIPHVLRGKVPAFGVSIPLYNMVWHDCLVCPSWINQNPHEQAVVKEGMVVPQTRDARLWALLWGGPPALRTRTMDWGTYADRDFETDAAFIASLKPVWEFNGAVGFERVADWELLSPDGLRQRTVFENGAEAEVDFAGGGYRLKVGKKRSKGIFT
jgi:hypothetical protein